MCPVQTGVDFNNYHTKGALCSTSLFLHRRRSHNYLYGTFTIGFSKKAMKNAPKAFKSMKKDDLIVESIARLDASKLHLPFEGDWKAASVLHNVTNGNHIILKYTLFQLGDECK